MYRHDLPSTRVWTRREEKEFEAALLAVPENAADRWNLMAERLGKPAAEIRNHYDVLVQELADIEAGRYDALIQELADVEPSWAELPSYEPKDDDEHGHPVDDQISSGGGKRHGEPERKKGTPWTEEEHRYGKGDWRSISRNVVVTRTPTQVASHAQKFFIRLNSGKKYRKRQSIHDIKTVDVNSVSLPIDQNLLALPATAPLATAPVHWVALPATPPVQQLQVLMDQNPPATPSVHWVAPPATVAPPTTPPVQQAANQSPNKGGPGWRDSVKGGPGWRDSVGRF